MTDPAIIRSLLHAVPAAELDYNDWLKVGMALHHEGLPLSLWEEWSALDTQRYHEGECKAKWENFSREVGGVTIGSLYYLARQQAESAQDFGRPCDWDDEIDLSSLPPPQPLTPRKAAQAAEITVTDSADDVKALPPLLPLPDPYDPVQDITEYLSALFRPEERVCYTAKAYLDKDGKWKPTGHSGSRTCGELLASLRAHPEDVSDTFGTQEPEAGVWICINPMDGEGRNNRNVTDWRYALVECDKQPIGTQYALIQQLQLPVKMLVHSGGKSLHAIVRVDARDYEEYQQRVRFLFETCRMNGLEVDPQNKNPSRLSRFPGFRRGERWQYIVGRDLGAKDWNAWIRTVGNECVEPLPVVNLASIWDNPPPRKKVLIEGILRVSHKLLLVSSSKAGKTSALLELAIAIAEGLQWFGCRCATGNVLYLNLEVDPDSFDNKLLETYAAMELKHPHPDRIDLVNLRGQSINLNNLVSRIQQQMQHKEYAAVIIDPIYKLGIPDENAAGEIAKFCVAMDQLANAGPAVIYCHHHSKGSQGSKSSMDRASGSGVFARDADALLDLIQLEIPEEHLQEAQLDFGEKVTAWRLECTLREFPPMEPVNLFFSHPLHETDDHNLLGEAMLKENTRAMKNGREIRNGGRSAARASNLQRLKEAIERDMELFGHRKTQEQYARELGLSIRTISRYYKELGITDDEEEKERSDGNRQNISA